MKVGDRIRNLRKERKLTQEEMATVLNISQRAYSKMENNEVQITPERLEEIAKALNVEVSRILPSLQHQIIEKVTHSQIGSGKVINQASDKERDLYEQIIQAKQTEIDYLKKLLESYQK
ncbi:MAG: helix-turn-helix domain-containing protein [Flavobacteriales bacterium]